jgi:hypothetical protein
MPTAVASAKASEGVAPAKASEGVAPAKASGDVAPAKAGALSASLENGIPAFAGMTPDAFS